MGRRRALAGDGWPGGTATQSRLSANCVSSSAKNHISSCATNQAKEKFKREEEKYEGN